MRLAPPLAHATRRALTWMLLTVALIGHTAILALSAADALISAKLGTPRLTTLSRRAATLILTTWHQQQGVRR